jgi:hypothetical protein
LGLVLQLNSTDLVHLLHSEDFLVVIYLAFDVAFRAQAYLIVQVEFPLGLNGYRTIQCQLLADKINIFTCVVDIVGFDCLLNMRGALILPIVSNEGEMWFLNHAAAFACQLACFRYFDDFIGPTVGLNTFQSFAFPLKYHVTRTCVGNVSIA